ncbi:hypothetical protein SK128_027929, partial [Halocaridina rubra]
FVREFENHLLSFFFCKLQSSSMTTEPIWDGHVNVGELLSPVLKALSSTYNTYTTDMYGNAHQDRVLIIDLAFA